MRAPAASQIRARTGTRRRLEPRYLITGAHGVVMRPVTWPTLRWAVMASGDRRETPVTGEGGSRPPDAADSHWVRWHGPYEDPDSSLSLRLRTVQSMVRDVLDGRAGVPSGADPDREPVRRAGSRRDRRRVDPSAGSGGLGAAGRARSGPGRPSPGTVPPRPAWPTGSGSWRATRRSARWYADDVPADLVLVCGVFGNISRGGHHRAPSRPCGGSADRVAMSSGPGTAARPMPPPPSGPTSPPPGSPRSPSWPPRGP